MIFPRGLFFKRADDGRLGNGGLLSLAVGCVIGIASLSAAAFYGWIFFTVGFRYSVLDLPVLILMEVVLLALAIIALQMAWREALDIIRR